MENYLIGVLLGYVLGALNPAALIGKLKKRDLRQSGTRNLGATNTMLICGKGYGAAVMLFDIAKAYAAFRLAELLFPQTAYIGMAAGCAAVAGHVYPFYLGFRGGKGLAAYGGLVLAADARIFLLLLGLTLVLMIVFDHGVAMPLSASVLFPLLLWIRSQDAILTLLAVSVSALVAAKHWSNLGKAQRGEDTCVRDYLKDFFFPRRQKEKR